MLGSIRGQILLFIAVVIMASVGSGALILVREYGAAARLVEGRLQDVAEASANGVSQFVEDTRASLAALATDPDITSMEPRRCATLMTVNARIFRRYANFLLVGTDGGVVCTGVTPFNRPAPTNVSDRPWWPGATEPDAGFAVGPPQFGLYAERPVVVFSLPVMRDGMRVGYVLMTTPLERFRTLLTAHTLPEGGVVTLATADGRLIARSTGGQVDLSARLPPAGAGGGLPASATGVLEASSLEGVPTRWSFRRTAGVDWVVFAGLPRSFIRRSALASAGPGLGVLALLVLASALLGFRLNRRVGAAIAEVVEGAEQASVGRIPALPEVGPEEVQALASAFNRTLAERNRALEEQRQAQERLIQAQKMEAVGRLAGSVAHDFNNLLTVINGSAEILARRGGVDGAFGRRLEAIAAAGAQAASLTQQLMALGRSQVSRPRPVRLDRVVAEQYPVLRSALPGHVEFRVDVPADLPPLFMDPGQLQQILLNLAVNGRDAMPEGGTFSIRARGALAGEVGDLRPPDPGRWVLLRVSDTGVGMEPEALEHLFEPFFTTKETGTGLGLASVAGIVEESGGTIRVESEPGRGTAFRILLPAAAAEDVPSDDGDGSGETLEEFPPGSVLVVDDASSIREMVREILEAVGVDVRAYGRGVDAVEAVRSEGARPDLLLTDVVLPDMGGKQVAEEVRLASPGTKVLFMTGYAPDVLARNRLLPEDAPVLDKPFTASQLLARLGIPLDDAETGRGEEA